MTDKEVVLTFLSQNSFILVNEAILRALEGDCRAAVMLQKLVSMHQYFEERGAIKEFGWFFQGIKTIEEKTRISEYNQRQAFNDLEEMGLIEQQLRDSPPRRYFKLDFSAIRRLVELEVNRIVYPRKSSKTKDEFYRIINETGYDSLEAFSSACGNIQEDMIHFMYAWGKSYKKATLENWNWNTRIFGIWRTYWRANYLVKPFDYNSLREYTEYLHKTNLMNMGLDHFIIFDKQRPETFIAQAMSFYDFMRSF